MNKIYFGLSVSNAILWLISCIIMIISFRANSDNIGARLSDFILTWMGTIPHTIFLIFSRYESECIDGLYIHAAYSIASVLLCLSIALQIQLIYLHVKRVGYKHKRKVVVLWVIRCCFLIKLAVSNTVFIFMIRGCDWYFGEGYVYISEGTTTTCLLLTVAAVFGDVLSNYRFQTLTKTPLIWIGMLFLILSAILHTALIETIRKYDELLQCYCATQAIFINVSNVLMGLEHHQTGLDQRPPQSRARNNDTEFTEIKQDNMDDNEQGIPNDQDPQTNQALLTDDLD